MFIIGKHFYKAQNHLNMHHSNKQRDSESNNCIHYRNITI